ncbi:hypothetical protein GCM10011611_17900 [Aliidongia dinghuensis]|uniref:Uncharacterized protein n=1 Tax=Aliidongia dinghuensis TaxID=1867774 RepID=A0A8J2YS80_9PROT|nr:hypothetical protein GCM10011611_17900 [Aliidongia dinghuensis]
MAALSWREIHVAYGDELMSKIVSGLRRGGGPRGGKVLPHAHEFHLAHFRYGGSTPRRL